VHFLPLLRSSVHPMRRSSRLFPTARSRAHKRNLLPHLAAHPRPLSPCLTFGRQPLVLHRPTEEQTQPPMGWSHCRTCVGSGTTVDKLPAASNRTYLDAQGQSAAGARRGKADCPGSVQPAGRRGKPAGAGPDGRWQHGSDASPRVTTVAQADLRVRLG
jgi:hypothetical protein